MAFAWLGAVLAALWLLGVLLSRHIQGLIQLLSGSPRVATSVYDLLVLPGVVLHELSHVAAALLLGIRVQHVNLFQLRRQGDNRQGEVIIDNTDPLRLSLVGAAPLLGGIAALLLLVRWLDPPAIGLDRAVLTQIRTLLGQPWTALGLYLLVAVANTMFPSAADRQAWWVVGVVIVVGLGLLFLLDIRPQIPPLWLSALVTQAQRLTAALLPVVVVDLVVLTLVLLLELLVGRIRGRRVVYRTHRS